MTLPLQVLLALLLDQLLGDPAWLPHPVRWIGRLATRLEALLRPRVPSLRWAGVLAVVLTVGMACALVWGLLQGAVWLHPMAADMLGIWVMYTTVAARDLVRHSQRVYAPLAGGNLPEARRRVACIVGRDTEGLDEAGIVRAAVETVAESTVDGVTAPLFYALIGGPVGAMAYRTINTLDSTFGYRNERYLQFGWAAARLDDLANWLPARLTAPLMVLAAALSGRSAGRAWRTFRRDGRKHESPNAGLVEATMAGALNVQLGGTNLYEGEPLEKPVLGDPGEPLRPAHIQAANRLMLLTLALFASIGLGLRLLLLCGHPFG